MLLTPTYVISSNINAACWHDGDLYLRFNSGITYRYDAVPYTLFDAMIKDESAGKFFHRHIRKGNFKYMPLDYDPFTGVKHLKAA